MLVPNIFVRCSLHHVFEEIASTWDVDVIANEYRDSLRKMVKTEGILDNILPYGSGPLIQMFLGLKILTDK